MYYLDNKLAAFSLALLVLCLFVSQSNEQYYGEYTTNVYGRTPFLCYTCTNNQDAANYRSKFYLQASEDCGFNYAFNPNSPNVQKTPCYTYCMKKETGIIGSRIDVERRCEPTCQEYDGNPRINYLVDKISCCVGNYCNLAVGHLKPNASFFMLSAVATILLLSFQHYF